MLLMLLMFEKLHNSLWSSLWNVNLSACAAPCIIIYAAAQVNVFAHLAFFC